MIFSLITSFFFALIALDGRVGTFEAKSASLHISVMTVKNSAETLINVSASWADLAIS